MPTIALTWRSFMRRFLPRDWRFGPLHIGQQSLCERAQAERNAEAEEIRRAIEWGEMPQGVARHE